MVETPRIADLKRRMAAAPASRIFMDLAREYHEAGQLETAADICVRGLKQHPGYLSARVLLGRIFFDMGRTDDSREVMEAVLAQSPDNLMARRVLAEISLEEGDTAGALDRFRALLAFNPADAGTRMRIEELEAKLRAAPPAAPPAMSGTPPVSATPAAPASGPATTAGSLLEAVEEPGEDLQSLLEPPWEAPPAVRNGLDPGVLATPTLAEIYLQQGLQEKAAQVYREILRGDPTNEEARARLDEIEKPAAPPADPAALARQRTIAALSSWLAAIRGGAGA